MSSSPVTIIKVGGSLIDWPGLPDRLLGFLERRQAEEPGFRPVLLAGGGPFADVVRRVDMAHHLGDFAAHRLAIQAMDLASTVLFCLLPDAVGIDREEALDEEIGPDDIPMLVPSAFLDDLESRHPRPFPTSWDVTSDTLSAWIAGNVRARSLILLKSAPLPPRSTRDDAARLGRVDRYFPLISSAVARVEYFNLRDPAANAEPLP